MRTRSLTRYVVQPLALATTAFAACASACATPRHATAATPQQPADHADVDTGSLVHSDAWIRIDVLIPVGGDLPEAVEHARATAAVEGLMVVGALADAPREPMATIGLASIDDQNWRSHIGGQRYASTGLTADELERVRHAVGVVHIAARGSAAHGWDLIRAAMRTARDLAASQQGWIFEENRARLFDVESFSASIPELDHHDVRAILRAMPVVSTHGGPDHVRSIGLAELGMPDLYLPDVPEDLLDVAANVTYATAQQLIQHGGVTRRGVIEVDAASLPASWGRPRGTGKILWRARWMHDPVRPTLIEIELTSPDLAAALRAF